MSIQKVVIPMAGLGTRLLPTTRVLPKEMLPLGHYPLIQHVVEEMVAADLRKVLFITARAKAIIENHFDNNSEVIIYLQQNGRLNDLGDFDYRQRGVEFFYTRQYVPVGKTKPLGTGEAVASAESFVDGESFIVAYGDTLIRSEGSPNLVKRMIDSHLDHGSACTIAVREISPEMASRYGIVTPSQREADEEDFEITDIVEKPEATEAPSRFAVSARYLFGPEIFEEIRATKAVDGEIQLTDAIRGLIRKGHMVRCVKLKPDETRYDIGNHESYFKAFIDYALSDPYCGEAIARYIREKLGTVRDEMETVKKLRLEA